MNLPLTDFLHHFYYLLFYYILIATSVCMCSQRNHSVCVIKELIEFQSLVYFSAHSFSYSILMHLPVISLNKDQKIKKGTKIP